jgi:hypothetical protein
MSVSLSSAVFGLLVQQYAFYYQQSEMDRFHRGP